MAACPRCGERLSGAESACPRCGLRLEQQARAAQAASPWAAVPFRTIVTAIWLTVGSIALVLLAIELKKVIFHVVIAIFLALVVNPGVELLRARAHLSRGKSIAIAVVVLTIAMLGVGALMAVPLATQGADFATKAPGYIQQAQEGKGPIANLAHRLHLDSQLDKAGPGLSKTLSRLSAEILTFGRRIASAAFTATIVVILAIFMLVEGPAMMESALRAIPPPYREPMRRIGRSTAKVVSGYTAGVLLMAAMNGAVAGVALTATRTPFVLPLSVWAAVVDILPIVGGLLAIVPAALFAFVKSVPAGIIVVVAMLVYQQVKNHVLYPIIVGRAVQLGSLLVLVAVLAGAELGGVAGAILAIPVAGTMQGVLVEVGHLRDERRAQISVEGGPSPPAESTAEQAKPGRMRLALERWRRPKQ